MKYTYKIAFYVTTLFFTVGLTFYSPFIVYLVFNGLSSTSSLYFLLAFVLYTFTLGPFVGMLFLTFIDKGLEDDSPHP